MIIEVLKKEDIEIVEDTALKGYLEYSLKRLPEGFDYYHHTEEFGYFCVVTSFEDMNGDGICLHGHHLRSIDDPLFWDAVELVEEKKIDGKMVAEILVSIDTDCMISLIFLKSILPIAFIRQYWLI